MVLVVAVCSMAQFFLRAIVWRNCRSSFYLETPVSIFLPITNNDQINNNVSII